MEAADAPFLDGKRDEQSPFASLSYGRVPLMYIAANKGRKRKC